MRRTSGSTSRVMPVRAAGSAARPVGAGVGVDAAAAAGAELVKFQCHMTDKEMVPTDMTPGAISSEKLWDIIKRCELTAEEEKQVQAYCAKKGVMYLSTPFSREAADRLNAMGVPAFKIGSGECNNYPLLDHIAKFGKPMILRLETRYGATELTFFFEDESLTKRLVEAINDAVKTTKPLDACPEEAAACKAANDYYGYQMGSR